MSDQPKPFLKWAGGKGRLLPHLLPRLPDNYYRYHEPFAGGAALFFALNPGPGRAFLADVNAELIAAYEALRDCVGDVIAALKRHRYEADYYYSVRAQEPETLPPAERAARVIFLNRTCFNGLWRTNRQGRFNVSFGRYADPVICNEPLLRACSIALRGVRLVNGDFDQACEPVNQGDFVYLDPPYAPISATASFVSYAADGFGPADQERLAATFDKLAARGAYVMASNSDTPLIRSLYRQFNIQTVGVTRAINSKASRRSDKVSELIITSY